MKFLEFFSAFDGTFKGINWENECESSTNGWESLSLAAVEININSFKMFYK